MKRLIVDITESLTGGEVTSAIELRRSTEAEKQAQDRIRIIVFFGTIADPRRLL